MVAMVLLALSSRLQPGEHDLHYSHGGRKSIHSEQFFAIREIVHLGVSDLCALVSKRLLARLLLSSEYGVAECSKP
jgi:hypothetical protein